MATTSSTTNSESTADELFLVSERCRRLRVQIHSVIIGQEEVVEQLLICLLAGGHCLLIGVPGLAKTLLVRTLAEALTWDFKRIQFTPDLMPGDILGSEILETDQETGLRQMKFLPGPIFTNVLLADEINRTPPKTQSALLEAMQESKVTVAGRSLPIDPPFFVVATQNPIEQEGTYPLPEAQLDRFMFSLNLTYPDQNDEEQIVAATTAELNTKINPVFSRDELLSLQKLVRQCPVSPHLITYAVSLARATRPANVQSDSLVGKYVEWGAGPRASQYLILGAKARAVLHGKPAPSTSDVRAAAAAVLRHRIVRNYAAVADGVTSDLIIGAILKSVTEPNYI